MDHLSLPSTTAKSGPAAARMPDAVAGPGLRRSRSNAGGVPHVRVVPWQGNRHIALVGPARTGRAPTSPDLVRVGEMLDARGVTQAVTPALTRYDSQPFLDAGFVLLERLHLLSRPVAARPAVDAPPSLAPNAVHRLRPGRAWHRRAVLDIDRRAFDSFWRFDATALAEARSATPSSRFRVAYDRRPIGYAVTGRAGVRGYLQRLAVDPNVESRGTGTALVNDSLAWLAARGARVVMVNTQERNQRALRLYEHLGFQPEPDGLVVLERRPRP